MKNIFYILIAGYFSFLSCRGSDEDVQQIDQVIHLYIDSAGIDMLNAKIPAAYSDIKINDVNGLTDIAPVSFSLRKNSDTVNYIEYVAAARRILVDSAGTNKTYESKLALAFSKRNGASTPRVITDTLRIRYQSTPELFQVSQIWFNNILKFTKTEPFINVVKVTK